MILIIIIAFFVLLFGLGSLFWYAFRFEVTNFQLINNKIYLKNKLNQNNIVKIKSTVERSILNEDLNLKILHLSDFHLRNDFKGKKLRKLHMAGGRHSVDGKHYIQWRAIYDPAEQQA